MKYSKSTVMRKMYFSCVLSVLIIHYFPLLLAHRVWIECWRSDNFKKACFKSTEIKQSRPVPGFLFSLPIYSTEC